MDIQIVQIIENKPSALKHFQFNIKQILIDEIALEGLEGIGFDLLWRRIEHRLSSPVTEKMKLRFWKILLNSECISMYILPQPLEHTELVDRYTIIDQESGNIKDPEFYLDGPFEYCPVSNELGSCKYYNERILMPKEQFEGLPLDQVEAAYKQTLVMVASKEERWHSLAGHLPICYLNQLTNPQYCILELIGRSRENGQVTTGTTNLLKLIKEPKTLYYYRKALKDLNLIKSNYITQVCGNRGTKSILLRLVRFYKPTVLTMPKVGKIHNIIEYLKTRPGYTETTEVMWKKGLLTPHQRKKFKKTVNVFDFELVTAPDDNPKMDKNTPPVFKKRKMMFLTPLSDESSQSEDEIIEKPLKCQFKVGIGLLRQAYEQFLGAGPKGLTQVELAQLLGLQFYTARNVCRIFKGKHIITEYFEDRGRQRVSRYIATAAGLDNDVKYTKEKQKFLKYIKEKSFRHKDETNEDMVSASTSQCIKAGQKRTADEAQEEGREHITEIKGIVGPSSESMMSLAESGKITMRQLKYANGLIKIIREKECVTGYQTISNLVAKQINEPPMVTKALKLFIQKLAMEGQIKVYKIKWPGLGNEHNFINVICAPHIKSTDPIVRAKYKEVYLRAMQKRQPTKKETVDAPTRSLPRLVKPRYMKMQGLHECITKMVYFEPESHFLRAHQGFLTVAELLPEITVKFAISNMSLSGTSEINHLKITDKHLNMKLKDAPPEICHFIVKSKSLRNAIRLALNILAMHGLIQLIFNPDKNEADYTKNFLPSYTFYVNRYAKIINTAGNWPREYYDIKKLEKSYYFETYEDVVRYWTDVYDISIATNVTVKNRNKKKFFPPLRKEEEVHFFDNGDRYGDGAGPCGFDSCFYMEIPRLWHTFFVRKNKQLQMKKKTQITMKMIKPEKKPRKQTRKPKVPIPKINNVVKLKRNRKPVDTAIKWSKEEDGIIVMCMVAITIASPNSQPGSLRIRNFVAKDILTKYDPLKTQTVCHRRALILQQNSSYMHEKDTILNEMRRRPHLILKYEGMIKKWRLRHSTNIAKFINEARLQLLELVLLIMQVTKSESFNRKFSCIAVSVESFYETYTVIPSTANRVNNTYKSSELGFLRESVIFTIMQSYNNTIKSDIAKKIYNTFKVYPENNLRIVVDQLRRLGAISAKDKIFNNQMHRLHLEDIVQSAYKISAKYQNRWIGRLNSDFVVTLGKVLEETLPSIIKRSAEVNCMFCELHACNIIELIPSCKPSIVNLTLNEGNSEEQVTVNDIETNYKLKSGQVTWRENPDSSIKLPTIDNEAKVSLLYENTEFSDVLNLLSRNAVLPITDDEQMYNLEDPIIKHLYEKGKVGATFKDLQAITGYTKEQLISRLNELESDTIIKRVGYDNNYLVLSKHINNWALKVDNNYVIITPWLNMNYEIRYTILLEWAGVIMNKIFEYPGCSVQYISDAFEFLTTKAVQDVFVFLERCKCIRLHTIIHEEVDLFSNEDQMPELSDFNPYALAEDIVAIPLKNSLSQYAYLRKTMLEQAECSNK